MAVKIMPDNMPNNTRGRVNVGYTIIAAIPEGHVNGHTTYYVAGVDATGNAVTWWTGFQPKSDSARPDWEVSYSNGHYFPVHIYPDARKRAIADMVKRAGYQHTDAPAHL